MSTRSREQLEQLIADVQATTDELQAAIRAHSEEVERFATPPRIARSWCRLLTALATHTTITGRAVESL